jgi:uncharacterized membrane protein
MSAKTSISGLVLAAAGLSHFVKPQLYESITASAFPTNTRQHIYLNGGIETALGAGLLAPRTRRFAVAGVVGYIGYLILSAVRSRG